MLEYDWPRNVRELKNVIFRAVRFASKDVILPEHIHLARKSKQAPAIRIDESGEIIINMPPDGISMQKLERKLLETDLIEANWNQTKAAELLYITRDTMRHRMKKYGLKPQPK